MWSATTTITTKTDHHHYHHACFQSNAELRQAVQYYVENPFSNVLQAYGYPISTWCTQDVTDFSHIFANLATFNEPLTGWNTSSAVTLAGMFLKASSFDQPLDHFDVSRVRNFNHFLDGAARWNQDISGWNLANAESMNHMFTNASRFRQSLCCSWSHQLMVSAEESTASGTTGRSIQVQNMFSGTSCPKQDDPVWIEPSSDTHPGRMIMASFCFDCTTATIGTKHTDQSNKPAVDIALRSPRTGRQLPVGTDTPSDFPSSSPTMAMTSNHPSSLPSIMPSRASITSNHPSTLPAPSDRPSANPSVKPTSTPTSIWMLPSRSPTVSEAPSGAPITSLISTSPSTLFRGTCQGSSESCKTDTDCCRDLFCAGKACTACRAVGGSCKRSTQCCGKMVCQNRKCTAQVRTTAPTLPRTLNTSPSPTPTRFPRTKFPTHSPVATCSTFKSSCGKEKPCCRNLFCGKVKKKKQCKKCFKNGMACSKNFQCCSKLLCSPVTKQCVTAPPLAPTPVPSVSSHPSISQCRSELQPCQAFIPCCEGLACSRSGLCKTCSVKGATFRKQKDCCDTSLLCSAKKGCTTCLRPGDTCQTANECCGKLVCLRHRCGKCVKLNHPCQRSTDCCKGTCVHKVCVR